jgi:hypothetical protein
MRVSIKRPLAMKLAFTVGAIALQAIVTGDERGTDQAATGSPGSRGKLCVNNGDDHSYWAS